MVLKATKTQGHEEPSEFCYAVIMDVHQSPWKDSINFLLVCISLNSDLSINLTLKL